MPSLVHKMVYLVLVAKAYFDYANNDIVTNQKFILFEQHGWIDMSAVLRVLSK